MEDAADRDRLVVAVALQVERGEAQRRTEGDDRGESDQVRRVRRPPPFLLQPAGYGRAPAGGGGGSGCGGSKA